VPFPVLLSTLIRSRFQAKPATLLIFLSYFKVEELYGTRYQSGSFSLINVGSGFHCPRIFLFLFPFLFIRDHCDAKNSLLNIGWFFHLGGLFWSEGTPNYKRKITLESTSVH